MTFTLMPLPYDEGALSPQISAETLKFHHGKHHKTYVDTLNKLVEGSDLAGARLEEIVQRSYDDPQRRKIFNNAGQVWNHNFFWNSMAPQGSGEPDGELARQIDRDFGSLDEFRAAFKEAAVGRFGSGWAWLVLENGKLKAISTPNGEPPMVHGMTALLTCDVWEHAYYLDYQNRRADFVQAFIDKLINWEFAARNFALQGEGDHVAARNYQDQQTAFAHAGRANAKAREARDALEGAEGEQLRQAEASGRSRSKGEDPALHGKRTVRRG